MRSFNLKTAVIFHLIIALMVFFSYPQVTHAAALTALSDTMSREKPSTLSNHTIKFTTPTGVAAGQTIAVTMPTGFTIGTVDFTDIDVSWGDTGTETELTLAAAPSGATWGAVFAGQILTLTSGTGVIDTAHIVIFEIGTNVTGGDQQIQNHATPATYTISIAGTFTDTGKIAIVIEDSDDQVVVSTTIDPQLSFSITTNTVSLTHNGTSNPSYADTGFSAGAANTLAASTNANSGYYISYNGATLANGATTIDAMAAKTTSSAGTEQFGINLKANTIQGHATGAEPSGGSGHAEDDYNTVDQFKFATSTATNLAHATTFSATTTYTVSYIVNVTTTTEAITYSTTITYICTGNF